jgi:hypothetical protein
MVSQPSSPPSGTTPSADADPAAASDDLAAVMDGGEEAIGSTDDGAVTSPAGKLTQGRSVANAAARSAHNQVTPTADGSSGDVATEAGDQGLVAEGSTLGAELAEPSGLGTEPAESSDLDGGPTEPADEDAVVAGRLGRQSGRTDATGAKAGPQSAPATGIPAEGEPSEADLSPDGETQVDGADVTEGVASDEAAAMPGAYRLPTLLRQKERMDAAIARVPVEVPPANARQTAVRPDQRPAGQGAGVVPPVMADGMDLPPGVTMAGPAMAVPGLIPDLHAPVRSLLSAQADEHVAAEAMMRMASMAEADEVMDAMLPAEADPGNLTTTGTIVAGEVGATVVSANRPMAGQKQQQAHVAAILSGTALPQTFVASRAGSPSPTPSVPPPIATQPRQGMMPAARTAAAPSTPVAPQPERPRTPVTREMLAAMPPTLRPALAAVRLAETGAHGAWDQARLTDPRPLEQRPVIEPWARQPEAPRAVPSLMSYVQLGAGRAPILPDDVASGRIVMPQPAPQPPKPLVDRAAELASLVKATAESAVVSSGEEIPAHVARMRSLMGKVETDLAKLDEDLGKVMPRLAKRPNPDEEEDGFWDWLFGADEEITDDQRQVKREKAWEKAAEMRESLQTLTQSVKENRSQLFARETLAQANQALCVPLTLPGQPPIQAELLVHPDGEEKNRSGGGRHPTRIQLAIQTHHLGSVGISLETLGQRLSVGLQVASPEVKALFEKLTADLQEQLGHTGYQLDPIGVQVAAHEIMTSLLLPTKRTKWGTDAIEGIR